VPLAPEKAIVMKSYRQELWFHVPGRRAFINITREVEECLRESGIKEGLVLVKTTHMNFILQKQSLFASKGKSPPS
jgi:thiamine phosphate synthase YjbQ (UPF0047 family)